MTYTVDVARRRLPLRIAISTVANTGESVGNIAVKLSVLSKVKLVAVGMRLGARSVADFGSARDENITSTCSLQSDGSVDSVEVDLVV